MDKSFQLRINPAIVHPEIAIMHPYVALVIIREDECKGI